MLGGARPVIPKDEDVRRCTREAKGKGNAVRKCVGVPMCVRGAVVDYKYVEDVRNHTYSGCW